tara:strand:+ start:170 stop:418 length:249 start_codon:yes stop_codon:yes gene_type:complete
MKKYKLNNDKKKEPTPAQINKYKDFSTVAHNYQRLTKRPKKPLYRDPKFFILLVLLGLIFLLVFMETEKEEKAKKDKTEQKD